MRITIVAGARPNFIKIAPIIYEIEKRSNSNSSIEYRLIHTGQHYDRKLSETFFIQLKIPLPDSNFGVGSGSQAEQTARIMISFEKELEEYPCDVVLVVGDVNSTMACSIVAKKKHIDVVHVEGGIRSFDLSMPEEINRMVTDSISDYFYVTSVYAIENLKNLGVSDERIVFVGNTMIDTLVANLPNLIKPKELSELDFDSREYIVLTMHRPKNVDEIKKLEDFLKEIKTATKGVPVIFPVHPRTKKGLEKLKVNFENIHIIEPLGYLQFNYLVKNSICVITDSGGITEEATFMGIPCLTLRDNTERPETVHIGTNALVGTNPKNIFKPLSDILKGNWKTGQIPEFWDGKASERIIEHLLSIYN